MARVPLQTVPGVELEAGSEVQFGATPVEPMKDVVTDDIVRSGQAMQQFGQVLNKLDDEINDAEATQLSNEYLDDVNEIKNRYRRLEGVNAVGIIKGEDGENITVFDQYQNEMQRVLESYQAKASNGTVKYIFEKKASVYTSRVLDNMTEHSLTQQRKYHLNETAKSILATQTAAIDSYASWNDPSGEFVQNWIHGLTQIDELARIRGWNIDPNAIDPTDPKGERKLGISDQYLEAVENYNMAVMQGVQKKLLNSGNGRQIKDFLAKLEANQLLNPDDPKVQEIKKKIIKANIEHKNSICVDKTLSNNSNQNDGKFLSQVDVLSCLSSSNSHDNGIGGDVTGGLNSNEVDVTNKTDTENIETLNQLRNTSKFYQPDSKVKLIPQHQTTHLFAIQRLGVKQADSLYTKAKSSVEIDKERFKNDPEYAIEINKEIITNYNKLILEASGKKYSNKERLKLEEQIKELEDTPDVYVPRIDGGILGPIPGTRNYDLMQMDLVKNKKLIELREKLEKLNEDDPKYVEKVENDLSIITNNIDYNFNPKEPGIKVDPITGLQPLDVLKAKLKATITDPKELETAIKDLEIKYDKLKTERETVYNDAFVKAQEIAFAEPGGWKQLAANDIDINDFTEADQEILRNGPPEESDKETLVKLEKNPLEVRNNLLAHRHKITSGQFARLQEYAQELKSDGAVLAVTIDNDMLDLSLKNFNMGYIKDATFDDDDYLQIKGKWKQLIDDEQTSTGSKLTRQRKQELLNQVLSNTVVYDYGAFKGDHRWPVAIIDQDQMKNTYVKVGGKTIWLRDIPDFQRERIIKKIRANGQQVTEQLIADMWVFGGKSKINNQYDWDKYNSEQEKSSSTAALK
jgi:hypothetical protein